MRCGFIIECGRLVSRFRERKGDLMDRNRGLGWAGVLSALWMLGSPVARPAGASPDLELWRLDCGKLTDWDKEEMSDVFSYHGQKQSLADSE